MLTEDAASFRAITALSVSLTTFVTVAAAEQIYATR
jgi:hypothetical protein